MTWKLSMLFTKVVKIMGILFNMRILSIIHNHLLKENSDNKQTIEIRYGCYIHNNMHIIHKQMNTFVVFVDQRS